ncbi:Death ligand signal enhancer [Toxocara canis]|uniref:Death ligand signal enhancer n=1 Tax=Toxocara canis TaxID=6265 RepID=A0A0B2VAP8_TOXCA|nr:Death ligand signal enhancer [Toxocara canis]
MNAHRLVVSNVWRGLKLVPTNLTVHATSSTEYEREDLKRRCINLELCSTPPLACTDVDAFSSGLGYNSVGTGSICAFYEGPNTRRLDVFPVALNLSAALGPSKAIKETVAHVRKVRTAEAGVQTDLIKQETKPIADELTDMIDKFKGFVENEVGLEMAAENLGTEAIRSWIGAAKLGSGDAMYNLAMCYSNGRFVCKNLTKAVSLWQKASKLGHPLSMYQLAVCHIRGIGVTADRNYGISLMQKAAEAGCARAQYFMASKLLREGERDRSMKYLKGAIKQEDIRSDVKKWLKMDSLPEDVRKIVVASLDECL